MQTPQAHVTRAFELCALLHEHASVASVHQGYALSTWYCTVSTAYACDILRQLTWNGAVRSAMRVLLCFITSSPVFINCIIVLSTRFQVPLSILSSMVVYQYRISNILKLVRHDYQPNVPMAVRLSDLGILQKCVHVIYRLETYSDSMFLPSWYLTYRHLRRTVLFEQWEGLRNDIPNINWRIYVSIHF